MLCFLTMPLINKGGTTNHPFLLMGIFIFHFPPPVSVQPTGTSHSCQGGEKSTGGRACGQAETRQGAEADPGEHGHALVWN